MSYDLMVFDQTVAPRDRAAFMAWYHRLTEWEERRDYNSPEGMTGNLKSFYDLLRKDFPPLNGPDAADVESDEDQSFIAEYSCAANAIYLGFAWSNTEAAHQAVVDCAIACDVGFFDVSASDGIVTYDGKELEARRPETSPIKIDLEAILKAHFSQ